MKQLLIWYPLHPLTRAMRRKRIIEIIWTLSRSLLMMPVIMKLSTWQTTVVEKAPTIVPKDSEAPRVNPKGCIKCKNSVGARKRATRWQRSPILRRRRMLHPRSTLAGYLRALRQTYKWVRRRSIRWQEAPWSTITKTRIGLKATLNTGGGMVSWVRSRLRVDT